MGSARVRAGRAGANRADRCPEAAFWTAPGAVPCLLVGGRPSRTMWKKLRGFRAPAVALPFGMPAVSALRGVREDWRPGRGGEALGA